MGIKNNCRRATFQIETAISGHINLFQKMELAIHLAGCPQCRLYREQSRYIESLVSNLISFSAGQNQVMDEASKIDLQKTITCKTET